MSDIPRNLKYSREHEWVELDDDGLAVVGITDHAQEALGELVYVEGPEAGQTFTQGDACVVIESVKAASDVYAPVAGELAAFNEKLNDEPELVNQAPYSDGWLIKLRLSDPSELDALLDAEAYAQFLAESEA
jgi:glycine cleavage system H protein